MKRLPVAFGPQVEDQIQEQVSYIAQDSVENALAWEDRLRAAIMALADFHGHAIDEDASQRLGYPVRKVVFEGIYRIHYHVEEPAGMVRVVRFRHAMRQPPISP